MVAIEEQPPEDSGAVEDLLDRAFPDRHTKTAQRLRDGQSPATGLALVARDGGRIVGTLRFWHIRIGERHAALLLGPLAVDPAWRGRGIGAALMTEGLARAASQGHGAVILVGDAPYYAPFGFSAAHTAAMELPGPVDRARFLACEIVPGALFGASGLVTPDPQGAQQRDRPAA